MNVSSALVLEYEAQLKIEAMRQNRPLGEVDRFLDLIILRPFLRDTKDDFIIELAVACRADYIVTWNVRDFSRAAEYGIKIVRPNEFLNIVEHQS